MVVSKARITAIGSYVPRNILNNTDLETMVGTNDEWIVKRTGIQERRIADKDEFTSDLSVKAVENLVERFETSLHDVDFIISCTFTPDFRTPSVSAQVQSRLGIPHCGTMDVNAACAGFTYGLHVANGLVTSGLHKKILVIAAETMSKIMDYTDRTTCILFGDGAGAVLVEYDEREPSFLSFHLGSEGEGGIHLYCTNLSNRMDDHALHDSGCLVQNGKEVYKWAVTTVPSGVKTLMEHSGVDLQDVTWFIPHSSNLKMIHSISEKIHIPPERLINSLVDYGNTSSATIPLALDKGMQEGKVKSGDKIVLYGFGGGLTHCGLLIRWGITNTVK